MASPSPDLLVVGAGLAGGLLALEAAALGARVTLVGGEPMATAISYGGVPWWAGADDQLGRLQATAPHCWQALEDRHGPLGQGPAEWWCHWPQGQDPSQALAGLEALPHGPEFQWLEPQQWRREEPLLAEAAVGGFEALPYARADPLAFQAGLRQPCNGPKIGARRPPLVCASGCRWPGRPWVSCDQDAGQAAELASTAVRRARVAPRLSGPIVLWVCLQP